MQTLNLVGEMTIYTAAEQKKQLLAFLETDHTLEINLSHVSELDTAGTQLLILAKQEAKAKRKHLNFVMHSKPVRDILALANLTGILGDPLCLDSE